MAGGYYDSLPPSFSESAFVGAKPLTNYDFGSSVNPQFQGEFGVDTTGQFNQVAENLTGFGALAGDQVGWSFITAPEDVSWDVANAATRVDMFGTNNPPVVAGSRGMRDLTLGNALVEGFVRGVSLEGKIAALENLMNYRLNASDGFVSVPVYQVWANEKTYGGAEAYYIIKDVKVKETMRDLKGNATRAYVDISLMQVPAYQVNSGRDQASKVTSGAEAKLINQSQARAAQRGERSSTAATNAANQGVGTTKSRSGVNTGQQSTTKPVNDAGVLDVTKGNRAIPLNFNRKET